MPKVLHQTDNTDNEDLDTVTRSIAEDIQHRFYQNAYAIKTFWEVHPQTIADCECLTTPAHHANFWKYALLVFECGMYKDIKS